MLPLYSNLDETTRSVYKENVRLNAALDFHLKEGQELKKVGYGYVCLMYIPQGCQKAAATGDIAGYDYGYDLSVKREIIGGMVLLPPQCGLPSEILLLLKIFLTTVYLR